jgi:hypothetical protein
MNDAAQTLTVVIPLRVKPRGRRKAMVTPGVLALERRQDITLIKAVARAFRWRRMLESGRFATVNELAAAEKINSSYVSRVLRLTLLAPDIVEAILDGRQPEGMTLPGLLKPFPVEWADQQANLGESEGRRDPGRKASSPVAMRCGENSTEQTPLLLYRPTNGLPGAESPAMGLFGEAT